MHIRLKVLALLFLGMISLEGWAKENVNVGFIGPLSGGVSAIGLGGRNSADLAVRQRNADPNAKYHYTMISLDDACKPSVGVQVATRLASNPAIPAAVVHYCSAVATATVSVYHRFGLPVVIWGTIAPDITYAHNYKEVNRTDGTVLDTSKSSVEFLRDFGVKRLAILRDTTDFGQSNTKYFLQDLKKFGGNMKVIANIGAPPTQQDFTAELTKIKSLNPDAIYVPALAPFCVQVRRQMQKLKLNIIFFGSPGITSQIFINDLGPLADGVVSSVVGQVQRQTPQGAKFLKDYAAQQYKTGPEAYGASAYAAMSIVLDAIEKVGPHRAKLVDVIRHTKSRPSPIGPVTFDDHGQNITAPVAIWVVQDGKWVSWKDSEYASGKRKLPGQK